jgi:energy-coupling factor transporter ATP-binding protein EcfA2
MYERVSIHRFRGLQNVTLDRLAKINVVVGKNGTGKSTVLEALWLHANPTPSLLTRVDLFRPFSWEMPGIGRVALPWRHLFYQYDVQEPITISGQANGRQWILTVRQATEADVTSFLQKNPSILQTGLLGSISTGPTEIGDRLGLGKAKETLNPLNVGRPTLLLVEVQTDRGEQHAAGVIATPGGTWSTLAHTDEPMVLAALLTPSTRYMDEIVVRFGRIDQENKLDRVLKFVRILEPNLKRLSAIPSSSGGTNIYADIGQKELIPVQLMGGGFLSILAFAILTADLEGGLILIDEIENGVHYAALSSLWKGLYELCAETGAQVVATTHSLECLEAARTVIPTEAFLAHRLDRDLPSGRIRVESLDAAMLQSAADMGLEVR